jgi:hypothetical protein
VDTRDMSGHKLPTDGREENILMWYSLPRKAMEEGWGCGAVRRPRQFIGQGRGSGTPSFCPSQDVTQSPDIVQAPAAEEQVQNCSGSGLCAPEAEEQGQRLRRQALPAPVGEEQV